MKGLNNIMEGLKIISETMRYEPNGAGVVCLAAIVLVILAAVCIFFIDYLNEFTAVAYLVTVLVLTMLYIGLSSNVDLGRFNNAHKVYVTTPERASYNIDLEKYKILGSTDSIILLKQRDEE